MLYPREPDDIYEALVADLSTTSVPTAIMGATAVIVGTVVSVGIPSWILTLATAVAAISSVAKVALSLYHRSHTMGRNARAFEITHTYLTVAMAASIGGLGALLFQHTDTEGHILATALLFGYCAGVVSRLAVRPRIALSAVTIAATPCVISAGIVGGVDHLLLASIFLMFLLGSFETIAHNYGNASWRIAMQFRMASIARRDSLTGLLNRFGLREAFDDLTMSRTASAVHAFDLDGFKSVNDSHGHEAGDWVLTQIAERLREILAGDEIAARVGGDEFVVVQPSASAEEAQLLAGRMHQRIVEPYLLICGTTVRIGASFGISSSSGATPLEDLLREADEASYLAKRSGGGVIPSVPEAISS